MRNWSFVIKIVLKYCERVKKAIDREKLVIFGPDLSIDEDPLASINVAKPKVYQQENSIVVGKISTVFLQNLEYLVTYQGQESTEQS